MTTFPTEKYPSAAAYGRAYFAELSRVAAAIDLHSLEQVAACLGSAYQDRFHDLSPKPFAMIAKAFNAADASAEPPRVP